MSSASVGVSRRSVIVGFAGLGVLLATTSLTQGALAEETLAAPFSFESLTEDMRALAKKSYASEASRLPQFLQRLDYDAYRKIQPRQERVKSLGDGFGYHLLPFHLGWLYKEPVHVFEIADGKAQPLPFSAADFDYHDDAVAAEIAKVELPGVAGFRLNYPLNTSDKLDEMCAFLGASYFRALGRDNFYGASARGVVIDSWLSGPEEFPRFSRFYIERAPADRPLTVYAALEGESLTGAFRMVFNPATAEHEDTFIDVTARYFFRKDIAELGVAPLTSMFLFADINRSAFDDYRPRVHDSDGLIIQSQSGETVWRALNNTTLLGNSYFAQESPKAFGLMQRARAYEDYEDAGARYEKRPSILIEPLGAWGEGAIRLIEAPSRSEAEDNIGAFWVPKTPFKAGDSAEFGYRLRWGNLLPDRDSPLAYVQATRTGQGGVSGVENKPSLRKFVVDFAGGPLADPSLDAEKIDAVATVSGGGPVSFAVFKVPEDGVFRLAIDADITTSDPVELRAYLVGNGRQLTETWLTQWRAA